MTSLYKNKNVQNRLNNIGPYSPKNATASLINNTPDYYFSPDVQAKIIATQEPLLLNALAHKHNLTLSTQKALLQTNNYISIRNIIISSKFSSIQMAIIEKYKTDFLRLNDMVKLIIQHHKRISPTVLTKIIATGYLPSISLIVHTQKLNLKQTELISTITSSNILDMVHDNNKLLENIKITTVQKQPINLKIAINYYLFGSEFPKYTMKKIYPYFFYLIEEHVKKTKILENLEFLKLNQISNNDIIIKRIKIQIANNLYKQIGQDINNSTIQF